MSALAVKPTDSPAPLSFLAARWALDPAVTFLNHGSYGAVPRSVLAAQEAYRDRMEREPVRFFKVDLERLLDGLRAKMGVFLNCDADGLAFMPNATVALATILANTSFRPGDEVLLTDHEYQSGINELERVCARTGARVVTANIPFPVSSPEQVAQAVIAKMGPRTRLILVSHITSATSLLFPVEQIVAEAKKRGIETIVDGAHTPGQIVVDVASLDPTYYVGSGHKWLSAPKGTGFLWVHPSKREGFRPLWLSSRANKVRPERALFLRDFDYMGTAEYSGILAMADAVDALSTMLPGGCAALYKANHELILKGREVVRRVLGTPMTAPAAMVGSMATLIVPPAPASKTGRPTLYDDPLQDALRERHNIVVPIWWWGSTRVIRLSAQAYNTLDQFELLASALERELASERA